MMFLIFGESKKNEWFNIQLIVIFLTRRPLRSVPKTICTLSEKYFL